MESEQQISNKLVKRVINGQAQKAGISAPEELKSDEDDQLMDDVSKAINEVGESIDKNPRYKWLIENFARVANKETFWKLADKVFERGITCGRIVTLIWFVGNAVVKRLAGLFNSGLGIVSWILEYIRDNLLSWIRKKGGWVQLLF